MDTETAKWPATLPAGVEITPILRLIAAQRRKGETLLAAIFGANRTAVREQVAAALLGRPLRLEWNEGDFWNVRTDLLRAVGACGSTRAWENADFEEKAAALLA